MEALAGNAIVFGLPCQLVITRSQKTNGSLIFCTLIWGWPDMSSLLVPTLFFLLCSLPGLMTPVWSKRGKDCTCSFFSFLFFWCSIICLFFWHLWSPNIDCCTEKSVKAMFHKVFDFQSFVCFVVFGKEIAPAMQRSVSSDHVFRISCKSKGIKDSSTSLMPKR